MIDDPVQYVEDKDPSEMPSISSSSPKRSMLEEPFDLNELYDEDDDNQ